MQRLKNETRNVFAEAINKIAFPTLDDKRIQSIDSTESQKFATYNDLVNEKEVI